MPPPVPNSSDSCVDAAQTGSAPHNSRQPDADLLAQLHGPPQTGRLLSCLSQVLVSAGRKKATCGGTKKSRHESGQEKDGVEGPCLNGTTGTSLEDGSVAREAFLDDLCLHLSSGTDCSETRQAAAMSLPCPLLVPRTFRSQEACAIFTRLAESVYWRRALLIPLLRRWWREESHSFFTSLLLQIVTDAIGKGFLCLGPDNKGDTMENKEQDVCRGDGVKTCGGQDRLGAMQELEQLQGAARSFRGFCIGIDAILQSHVLRLMEHVKTICAKHDLKNERDLSTTGSARVEVEHVVDASTRSTWKDMFAFFSRCVSDVEVTFDESLWMFLMTLLTGYGGALQLFEMDVLAMKVDRGIVQQQAQRMFVENMQRNMWDYLTLRLSTDRVASGKSLLTIQNVLSHQSFFWKTATEVEVALQLLPPALLSRPDVRLWARQCTVDAWGNALRLVQLLVHGQEAAEEVPASVESAGFVSSSIRQHHRQLLEDHMERLAFAQSEWIAGNKRPCRVETNLDEEALRSGMVWSRYTAEFFLRTYHSSCFTILSLVEQDTLVALLRQLHAVIINEKRDAVEASLTTHFLPHGDNPTDERPALLEWHAQCVHKRVVQALKEDALLTMCLLRAVFVFFERVGKTNLNVHIVLRKTLLPILASLCSNQVNDNNDDDVEEYYERQQGIMMLLASGLLALPWDLRGVRARLVLHRFIGNSLQDCFSAEEALSETDRFFLSYTENSQTLEDTAASSCETSANDSFLQRLAAEGEETAAARDMIDDFVRCEAPIQFPAPCGTLLLMSVFRTMSLRFLQLRAEWEEQVRLVGEDARCYLGREATFCTTRDIAIFRLLIQLVHRMVFGFQVQYVGLLRMWLSYLNHLFTNVVPPLTEDDEISLLVPNKKQNAGHDVQKSAQRTYRRSPNETSQGELRAVLGELLADLALMPLVDSEVVLQCPAAVPHRPGGVRWKQQQKQRMQDVPIVQRMLPISVLEELCFALKIPTDNLTEEGMSPQAARCAGKMVEQSFLSVLGVVTFCQRLELFIVPGSFANRRCAALMQALWSAVEASSVTATT